MKASLIALAALAACGAASAASIQAAPERSVPDAVAVSPRDFGGTYIRMTYPPQPTEAPVLVAKGPKHPPGEGGKGGGKGHSRG